MLDIFKNSAYQEIDSEDVLAWKALRVEIDKMLRSKRGNADFKFMFSRSKKAKLNKFNKKFIKKTSKTVYKLS